jgi:hypothetical protein
VSAELVTVQMTRAEAEAIHDGLYFAALDRGEAAEIYRRGGADDLAQHALAQSELFRKVGLSIYQQAYGLAVTP